MTTEPFSSYVIRSEQFDALTDAAQIRKKAEMERTACLEAARQEAETIIFEARAEAAAILQQARDHARADVSRYLHACENSLADLSFLIARRLVDDLPRDEKLARLVKTAIADLPRQMGLEIKVPVSESASLKKVLRTVEGMPTTLSVVESTDLVAGEGVLQHEQGLVQLDIASQLRALWQAATA